MNMMRLEQQEIEACQDPRNVVKLVHLAAAYAQAGWFTPVVQLLQHAARYERASSCSSPEKISDIGHAYEHLANVNTEPTKNSMRPHNNVFSNYGLARATRIMTTGKSVSKDDDPESSSFEWKVWQAHIYMRNGNFKEAREILDDLDLHDPPDDQDDNVVLKMLLIGLQLALNEKDRSRAILYLERLKDVAKVQHREEAEEDPGAVVFPYTVDDYNFVESAILIHSDTATMSDYETFAQKSALHQDFILTAACYTQILLVLESSTNSEQQQTTKTEQVQFRAQVLLYRGLVYMNYHQVDQALGDLEESRAIHHHPEELDQIVHQWKVHRLEIESMVDHDRSSELLPLAEIVTRRKRKRQQLSPQHHLQKLHTGGTFQKFDSLLSPMLDRLDTRRHLSTSSYHKLGYNPPSSYVLYWESLLRWTKALYPTRALVLKAVAQVQHLMTTQDYVSPAEAYCALAEVSGCTAEAGAKLRSRSYRFEIQGICAILDVRSYFTENDSASPMTSTTTKSNKRLLPIPLVAKSDQGHFGSVAVDVSKSGKLLRTNFARHRTLPTIKTTMRPNAMIDQHLASHFQSLACRHETQLCAIDGWGNLNRVGTGYSRGRDINLYSPLQLTQESYDAARQFHR